MSSGTLRQLGTFEATWSSRTARIFEAHDRQIVAILLICLFAAAITLDIRVPLRTDELLTPIELPFLSGTDEQN